MSDLIEAGPRRCPTCRRVVTVLYDHVARWAFCPECKGTIAPRDQALSPATRAWLIKFKVLRCDRDGFAPKPHRSELEMTEILEDE